MLATWRGPEGEEGRSLILGGHVDVVPPAAESLWTRGPYEPHREGEWLYGRGAGDMKAGLAAVAGAIRALRSLGVDRWPRCTCSRWSRRNAPATAPCSA